MQNYKWKNAVTGALKGIALLLALNAIFYFFMVFIFSISRDGKLGEKIILHAGESLYTWEDEDKFPIFKDGKSYWNDLGSDMIWANIAVTTTGNAFQDAAILPFKAVYYEGDQEGTYVNLIQSLYFPDDPETNTPTYSRYWMLMAGVLKLLFIFWQIREIRYIFYFSILGLLVYVTYKIDHILGWKGVLPFTVAAASRVWLMHSICVSTMPDILITLVTMIVILHFYQKEYYPNMQRYIFLVTGAFSFALGPLVAPLLTLGIPLVLNILLLRQKDKDVNAWISTILNSAIWVFGYMGTLLLKQSIAHAFHAIGDGAGQAIMYIGEDMGFMDRINRLGYCFMGLLQPVNVKGPFLALIILALVVMMVKKGFNKCDSSLLLFFVAMYPVIWVFVIARHSQHYFAANIMSIFVYAILSILAYSVNDKSA
ncbi:MAG: hypothetical protein PHP50_07525 [Lachnospiraceae bacterium]|nr:hypothetical protein [Lachnospiraceae bacterium]